ncbi:MAG: acetamidase/formamidase family protein [Candidatus Bathyarchaeia archaeon]
MEHRLKASSYCLTFGPNKPELTVKPGDTVTAETVDARGYDAEGRRVPDEMRQRRPDLEFCPSNPLVGPIFVEGAYRGDTLRVRLDRIRLNRGYAWSRILPNFGSFTAEVPGKRLLLNEPLKEVYYEWRLNLERNTGVLDLPNSRLRRAEIPLHPFLGSIGVAPRFGRCETALTPGEYGGNMDCVETREGTTLYFPVFVDGGYLAFGDVHAAQGDGEICGVALETSAEVTLTIDVVKGNSIEWPRFEDGCFIMTAGSARPLMDAFNIAHLEMVKWLSSDYGFDRWEALQLLSQVGTCRVGNVVDVNYTVVAKFPKYCLPR